MAAADGVFEGGGVKGIGLVGALLAFWDRGWTDWQDVAGTSAGAITAGAIACGVTPPQLAEILQSTSFERFRDVGRGGVFLRGPGNLLRGRGIARGAYFLGWMRELTGGRTFGEIENTDAGRRVKLIATDVTRREILVLPDDLQNYLEPGSTARFVPDAVPVAVAARMSMSIPYFFAPIVLVHADTGRLSTIVDGGVISNFPVWLFDESERAALRPTFGFRLVGGREAAVHDGRLSWPFALGVDIFHTLTDAWDTRFQAKTVRVRTIAVPADGIAATDFGLDRDMQRRLLENGRDAANAFLDEYRPEDYTNAYGRGLAG